MGVENATDPLIFDEWCLYRGYNVFVLVPRIEGEMKCFCDSYDLSAYAQTIMHVCSWEFSVAHDGIQCLRVLFDPLQKSLQTRNIAEEVAEIDINKAIYLIVIQKDTYIKAAIV